ncbi:hypothetical protein F2P56_001269 [Juglans regia]|uniref:Serine carboxypeptidase-like 45 n=2 Tax=Juglans regia TaxID=51240 RepID=A0A2I4F716_JUGRE|nr:serine carboxypeptidase-like 45 [Juglans regia]KAF5480527.1 hypothetical protein F2P56_001269 [Juglans regia]
MFHLCLILTIFLNTPQLYKNNSSVSNQIKDRASSDSDLTLPSLSMIMKFQQWIMVMGVICASFFQTLIPVESLPVAHKIKSQPGQQQVSFQQFAGFITIDEQQQRALFYYFVEAEGNPASKPLVLWLNGRPGCSSNYAGTTASLPRESHQIRQSNEDEDKSKSYPHQSFVAQANMLYLESPAGVGFSYSSNKSFYSYVDDEITTSRNTLSTSTRPSQLILTSQVILHIRLPHQHFQRQSQSSPMQ